MSIHQSGVQHVSSSKVWLWHKDSPPPHDLSFHCIPQPHRGQIYGYKSCRTSFITSNWRGDDGLAGVDALAVMKGSLIMRCHA